MRVLLLRASFGLLLVAGFSTSNSCSAESHCPDGVPSLHPRIVAGALLVVPVRINHLGPFDFMVDTGSQLNVIDPSLAARLSLKSQGTVGLIATNSYSRATVALLESLETGPYTVEKPLVVVQDLGSVQGADPLIRGVLGEDFLSHFDILFDYVHRLLCLDSTGIMQSGLRGDHIPLVRPKRPESELQFSPRLVVSVNLSATGSRPILLQLDSGSDGPILYAGDGQLEQSLLKGAKLPGSEVSEKRQAFAALPPQEMRIGARILRKVQFVTPVSAAQKIPDREENGILATALFERLFISHTGNFIILDPK
jgi:hypothetical protein